jgi:hypothetical protein
MPLRLLAHLSNSEPNPRCPKCQKMIRRDGIVSHSCRRPLWDRVFEKVDASGDCWEWTGAKTLGYGHIARGGEGGGHVRAHRAVWELLVGTIPAGLELDHLCRNTGCVNPDHLEAVTPRTNTLRSQSRGALNSKKVACPSGHPYDDENTYLWRGERKCRACRRKPRRAAA